VGVAGFWKVRRFGPLCWILQWLNAQGIRGTDKSLDKGKKGNNESLPVGGVWPEASSPKGRTEGVQHECRWGILEPLLGTGEHPLAKAFTTYSLKLILVPASRGRGRGVTQSDEGKEEIGSLAKILRGKKKNSGD